MIISLRTTIGRGLLVTLLATPVAAAHAEDLDTPVSRDQITFGHRQLEQLLDDRPDMRGVLPMDDPVTLWIVDSFNGKRFGQRIHWNNRVPDKGVRANLAQPYAGFPPYIAISDRADISPVDKWAAVVFEFHNIDNRDEFRNVHKSAFKGEIADANQYAMKMLEVEFDALIRTRKFFAAHPMPSPDPDRDNWYTWVTTRLGTFEDYWLAIENAGESPGGSLEHFQTYFHQRLAPLIRETWMEEQDIETPKPGS